MQHRTRRRLALVASLTSIVLAYLFLRSDAPVRSRGAADQGNTRGADPPDRARGDVPRRPARPLTLEEAALKAMVAETDPADTEIASLDKLRGTLGFYEDTMVYPLWSRPADGSAPHVLDPNRPVTMGQEFAADADKRLVRVDAELDRWFIGPGETAIARLTVDRHDEPGVPYTPDRALMRIEYYEPNAAQWLLARELPLVRSGDALVAEVSPSDIPVLADADPPYEARALARVEVGEFFKELPLMFRYTGHEPLRVLGQRGDQVVGGSLEVNVGVEVARVAPMHVQAALYDETGTRAIATYEDVFEPTEPGRQTMTLRFFGRILHEAGVSGRYQVRHLRGHALVPNHEPAEIHWAARDAIVTRAYTPTDFSAEPWTSPEKELMIARYKELIELEENRDDSLFATAEATGGNIVYIHGARMDSWPEVARLRSSASWTHRTLAFDGSARLSNTTVKNTIKNALDSYCTTTDCVVACYSAGCARLLLALHESSITSYRILWTEALASAAGGTELAKYSTNKGARLLAKLFLAGDTPNESAVDQDLTPEHMRDTLGHIQNKAKSPIYHLAGSMDICYRLNVLGVLAYSGAQAAAGWAIGSIVGMIIPGFSIPSWVQFVGGVFNLWRASKKKVCGNSRLPGNKGDGVMPVHSAAGYAQTGSYASHHTGDPKYTFRAYEQIELFDNDHRGMFRDFIAKGSLRLAVDATATCPSLPQAGAIPEASIVFEDADSAVVKQWTTDHLLFICGTNALADPVQYGSCHGTNGCCDNYEAGSSGGCTCGESLCAQSGAEAYSYFTGYACSGDEYAEAESAGPIGRTWDGVGMVGLQSHTVLLKSRLKPDGVCENTTVMWGTTSGGVCEYQREVGFTSTTARRVYRSGIQYYGGTNNAQEWPGWVVDTRTWEQCP